MRWGYGLMINPINLCEIEIGVDGIALSRIKYFKSEVILWGVIWD